LAKVKYLAIITAIILLGGITISGCAAPEQELPPVPDIPKNEKTGELPATDELEIINFTFSPAVITVLAGAETTWFNQDSTRHTVTSRGPLFDSGDLSEGQSFSFTILEKGSYDYYCTIHPYMTGKVIVE